MFCALILFSYLCVIHLFSIRRSKIFKKESCVDFDFISLIDSYVYIHIALCYQEFSLQDSCNNLAMFILYSEYYHQLS